MAKRIREYDESKITFMIEMVKCHYLGMIKMGKTKYHYNRYD